MRQHALYTMLTQKLLYLYALLLQFRRVGLIEYSVKLSVATALRPPCVLASSCASTGGVRGASGAAAKNCGRMVS